MKKLQSLTVVDLYSQDTYLETNTETKDASFSKYKVSMIKKQKPTRKWINEKKLKYNSKNGN